MTTHVLFAILVFGGATLTFVMQPMCAKMALPYLGGAPSVWTTCMLFFQIGLLAGYGYTHATQRLAFRFGALLHIALLLVTLAFFPPWIGAQLFHDRWLPPALWLFALLLVTVGLPYTLVAGSSTLLQLWFAESRHERGKDPYFLYAASNVGSLTGLLGYLFVVEPNLPLSWQSRCWSGAFAVYVALSVAAAAVVWRASMRPEIGERPRKKSPERSATTASTQPIPWTVAGRWMLLAAVPCSMMLSVTTHISSNLAAAPLLWVVPLSLYLVTYVVSFSTRLSTLYPFWSRWMPLVVIVLVLMLLSEATEPLVLVVGIHLVALFWIGVVCHGELAGSRPPIEHLTSFYLCLAAGGAIGGVFNAVVAPLVFDSLAEYPLAIVLACGLCRGTSDGEETSGGMRRFSLDVGIPLLLGLTTSGLVVAVQQAVVAPGPLSVAMMFAAPLVVCYTLQHRPLRFALAIGAVLVGSTLYRGVYGSTQERVRSFYGIHRVTHGAGGEFCLLIHGNTEHGRQSLDAARRDEPLSYYHRTGPIGDVFDTFASHEVPLRRIGVVGLGAGTLAAYAEAGQEWTFYEIDPVVVKIARDTRHFTYLQDAIGRGAALKIVVGDARVELARSRERYDLIVFDAFSSDSVPLHLATREALQVYRARLADGGCLAFHYSSRYLNLRPLLARLAAEAQPPLHCWFREDLAVSDPLREAGKSPSKWAVFAERSPALEALQSKYRGTWKPAPVPAGTPLWTDDSASILDALTLFDE